jgi:hypothetical protein
MKTVTRSLAALALALLAPGAFAADGRLVTLHLAHALREGETAWLQVQLGPLARGQQIEITTPEGRLMGVISPYGIRSGREAGTYTVPLPADAFSDTRISLRLSVDVTDHTQRAPTPREVKKVSVTVVRVPQ